MGDYTKPFFARHSLMLLLCASIFSSYTVFIHSTSLLNDGDALYALLFADSVVDEKTRFMWFLPLATFAFPDLFFSVAIAMLGISGIWFFLAFTILYYIFLILSLFMIFKVAFEDGAISAAASAFVIILILVLFVPHGELNEFLFRPLHHAGLIPLILISLSLSTDILLRPRPAVLPLLALAVVCAASTFSDRFFLIQFLIPMFATVIILISITWRRRGIMVLSTLLLGCFGGYVLERIFFILPYFSKVPDPLFEFSTTRILKSVLLIPERSFTIASELGAPALLLIFAALFVGVHVLTGLALLLFSRVQIKHVKHPASTLIIIFLFLSCISSFFGTFFIGSATHMGGSAMMRHQLPTYLFPLLIVTVVSVRAMKVYNPRTWNRVMYCLVATLIIISSYRLVSVGSISELQFLPKQQAIYTELKKMGVQAIFTDHGTAKKFRVISGGDMPVWQIENNMSNVGWREQVLEEVPIGATIAVIWAERFEPTSFMAEEGFQKPLSTKRLYGYNIALFEYTIKTHSLLATQLRKVVERNSAK